MRSALIPVGGRGLSSLFLPGPVAGTCPGAASDMCGGKVMRRTTRLPAVSIRRFAIFTLKSAAASCLTILFFGVVVFLAKGLEFFGSQTFSILIIPAIGFVLIFSPLIGFIRMFEGKPEEKRSR